MSPVFVFILVVCGIAGLVVLMLVAERRRRRKLGEFFTAQGGEFIETKNEVSKAQAFHPVGGLLEVLRTGAQGVVWSASLKHASAPVVVLEHSYTTGAGKSRTTHYHTVFSVRAPGEWSQVTITREHLFTKIGKALGMKDLDLEHPEFNRRWRVQTADENFALAAISPNVQQMLADPRVGDMGEHWRIGGGVVAMLVPRSLNAEKLSKAFERFSLFLDALEPELRSQIES